MMVRIKAQKRKAKLLATMISVLFLSACASHKLPIITPLQAKETASPYAGRNYVVCEDCVEYTPLKKVVLIHKMTNPQAMKQKTKNKKTKNKKTKKRI